MNINMNDVAKRLIENNQEPITSTEVITDEEVLRRLIKNNEYWLLPQYSECSLLDLYNHLFRLLTVDCLIFIRHSLYPVELFKNGVKEYLYELEWNYQKEKEISPPKHNLLIKINNSFPLRGYLPELCEFDYNQQFSAIERLVKDIHTIFVFKTKRTGEIPRVEFLVNHLIKEMNLELTDLGEVRKFANIVDISIDGVDFSAKIEKQIFSANLPELGGKK